MPLQQRMQKLKLANQRMKTKKDAEQVEKNAESETDKKKLALVKFKVDDAVTITPKVTDDQQADAAKKDIEQQAECVHSSHRARALVRS